MKKLIGIGVLVWLVVGLLGFAHAEESPLVFTIESDKKIYEEGTPINVKAKLENISKTEVLINTNASRTMTLKLTDAKGNEIKPIPTAEREDLGVIEKDFILLKPGKHCLLPIIKDGEFIVYNIIYVYPNLKRGEYLLSAKYDNHDNRYNMHSKKGKLAYDVMEGVWKGTLTSNTIKIQVAEGERKGIQSEIIQKYKEAEKLKEEFQYTKEKEEKVFDKDLEIAKLIVQNYPTKEREIKKIGDIWVDNILEYLMDYKYRIGDFQKTLDICSYVKESFPHNHSAIRALWKMAEVNQKRGNYEEALRLYQQVIDYEPKIGYPAFAGSAQEAVRQMAEIKREISGLTPEVIEAYHEAKDENMLYLIENYGDYEKKPLEIFLSADNPSGYQKIVSLYPNCKLAGYALFQLGNHYLHLSRRPENIEEKKELRDMGINYMERVIKSYPSAVFPNEDLSSWKKDQSIPLTAQLYIALAYEGYWTEFPAEFSKAIEEYRKLIKQFSKAPPDIQKTFDYDLRICAYVSMLSIDMSGGFSYSTYYSYPGGWSGNNEKQAYFNPGNARELIDILLKIPNQKFLIKMEYFGETHPEALMNLAFLEKMAGKDKAAIEVLEKIINDFPKSWRGKHNSGAVNPYFYDALRAMMKIINDDKLAIEECRKFAEGDYYSKIKGYALFEMAEIYQKIGKYEKAIEAYRKVKNEFADINLGGEAVNLGMLAEGEIQKLKRK